MEEYSESCESVEMKRDGAEAEDAWLISGRKRKYYSEVESEYGGEVESAVNSMSTAALRTSISSKVDDESVDVVKRKWTESDLEDVDSDSDSERFEVVSEISTSFNDVFSREGSSTSELCGDSEDAFIQSRSPLKRLRRRPATTRRKLPALVAEDMPSEAELENFFSAAEKYDKKWFAEKYNYDILKDVPLEGKYQWVRLQP